MSNALSGSTRPKSLTRWPGSNSAWGRHDDCVRCSGHVMRDVTCDAVLNLAGEGGGQAVQWLPDAQSLATFALLLDLAGISTEFLGAITPHFCFTYTLEDVTAAMPHGLHARLCHYYYYYYYYTRERRRVSSSICGLRMLSMQTVYMLFVGRGLKENYCASDGSADEMQSDLN